MSDDRVYLAYYPYDGRPAIVEDVGNILKIVGLIISGEGANVALIVPGERVEKPILPRYPNLEEWTAIIKASDDPIWFEQDNLAKIAHRKVLRQLSGMSQQKTWARDGFRCMYCGRKMGEVQLTVDHFVPLELGGTDDSRNYLSACRKCNKDKGMMPPEAFCNQRGFDYPRLVNYLGVSSKTK